MRLRSNRPNHPQLQAITLSVDRYAAPDGNIVPRATEPRNGLRRGVRQAGAPAARVVRGGVEEILQLAKGQGHPHLHIKALG